jgi:hypothetical protein
VLFFLPAFYSFTQGDSTIIPNYERVSSHSMSTYGGDKPA